MFSLTLVGCRGYLHDSLSEKTPHWTVRGFLGGHAKRTLHVFPTGEPVYFENGGHWEKKKRWFNLTKHCKVL